MCVGSKYMRERKTHNLSVVFYVPDDFSSGRDSTSQSLKQIERHVERDYISKLRNNCYSQYVDSEYNVVCTDLSRS